MDYLSACCIMEFIFHFSSFDAVECGELSLIWRDTMHMSVCARHLKSYSACSGICMADLILRGTFYRSFQQATGLRINVKDLRANPLTLLQPHIASNILPQNDIIFSPSESEMKAAEKIFVSSQQNNIKYLTSVMKNHQLPNTNLLEVSNYSHKCRSQSMT